MREYDRIAEWYAATRSPTIGVSDVQAFARTLPPRARILDLGCGDGVPITRELVRQGFRVTALDSSAEMIRRFRANLPGVPARCERAETAQFPDGSFDAAIAWGVLFHLADADQRSLIAKVSGWLVPGGRFLFTSGGEAGTREGAMEGVAFRYVSLGVDGYRRALVRSGVRLVRSYVGEGENPTYVAEKPEASRGDATASEAG